MIKSILATAFASLTVYTSALSVPAYSEAWSAVDCKILIDFVQRQKEIEEALHRDRLTLERSFRGTSYEGFSRVEEQLSEYDQDYWFFQDDGLFLKLMTERCRWP